jgi:ABC-type Fe3+/spermidine/putrescine transport system ATPase subunit
MTVFENVAYPLEVRGLPRAAVREKVARILDLVGLGGTETRPGTLLSGGQMQRLALCRALVYEPDLLLLDEPFSNLDAKLREQMRVEVKLLQRRLGITVLFVTHDQVEALSLSDRIAVMHRGRVEQVGTPRALYEQPTSAFVRDFLGQTVVLAGRVTASGSARDDARVTVAMNGPLTGCTLAGRSASAGSLTEGAAATIAIRPEDIQVAPDGAGGADGGHLLGTIDTLSFVGDRYEARVGLGGEHCIVLLLSRSREWREGERVRLGFPPELVSVWPA